MKVGVRNRDMLRARKDDPPWLQPAHDKPIEDEQVNEVEDEKHAEGIGEAVPEGVTFQNRGPPNQCRCSGSRYDQSEQERYPLLLIGSGRDDPSDFLRIMP